MLDIYNKKTILKYDCTQISISKWDELMEGSVKANGKLIRRMIKIQHPDIYADLSLQFPNPYEHQCIRTKTHLIYVHSMIEHFFKII